MTQLNLDTMFLEQYKELTNEEMSEISGGINWNSVAAGWSSLAPAFEQAGGFFGGLGSYAAYR